MINKVVVAAAGQGTRMRHLTRHKSKHLICVKKKAFLGYLLDNLLRAGYQEIILVVGFCAYRIKEFIQKYKPAKAGKNYKITLVNQYKILGPKEKEYGTLCPIKCVKGLVGRENFLAVYGDNLYSVRDLKAMNIDDNYNYVAGICLQNPEKYGVLVTDNGFLKKIYEKPKKYIGNMINTGLYKFTADIFKEIPKVRLSARGEYELTDAITLLAKKKKVKVKKIKDYWMDFGNPGDIIKLSRFLSQKPNKN